MVGIFALGDFECAPFLAMVVSATAAARTEGQRFEHKKREQCPVCRATKVLAAVVTKVIDRSLAHVKVPREPVAADEPAAPYFDVTGESVPASALGVDLDPDERDVLRRTRPRRGASEGRLGGAISPVRVLIERGSCPVQEGIDDRRAAGTGRSRLRIGPPGPGP